MAAARPLPLRPGAPPEIEMPARDDFAAFAALVGELFAGCDVAAALELEPEFETLALAPLRSGATLPLASGAAAMLVSALFSAIGCGGIFACLTLLRLCFLRRP